MMSAELLLKDVSITFPVFTGAKQQSVLAAAAGAFSFGRLRMNSAGLRHVESLRGISLHLKTGARLGLVGSNGSGKSSLLKTLAGIYYPTRGKRMVSGKVGAVLTTLAGLDGEKTGRENVRLLSTVFGLAKEETQKVIEDIFEFTELGDFFDMPIRVYSAGMQVRLNFALATALPSDILLIDEVLAAGDAHFASRARERLQTHASNAKILVLATHSWADLSSYCDYAICLRSGVVVDVGNPADVWNRYVHEQPRPEEAGPIPKMIRVPAADPAKSESEPKSSLLKNAG